MSKLLVYYAHPGQQFSHVNAAMWNASAEVEGITRVDLYAENPRFDINPDKEQERLLEHDIVLFQFPFFWYSTPSIIKEWQDLVLEHGFAYGHDGDKLAGKRMMLAITAAGPEDAYTPKGYQNHELRTFLTPLEQTANLCQMKFLPPYVLYGSLKEVREGDISPHVEAYKQLLIGLRDDKFDPGNVAVLTHANIKMPEEV